MRHPVAQTFRVASAGHGAHSAMRRLGLTFLATALPLCAACGGSASEPPAAEPPMARMAAVGQPQQVEAYGTAQGKPAYPNFPVVTVLINGHPFKMLIDTGQTGILITRAALKAAGVAVRCTTALYQLSYGDGTESAGCIAAATVSLQGNPAVLMNIGVDNGETRHPAWPIGDIDGDFGGGMSLVTFGQAAIPPTDTLDYVRAAGFAGFLLDCTTAPPDGGGTRNCILTPRNSAPSAAVALPMNRRDYPASGWTPVRVTFGSTGSPQVVADELFDTGTNVAMFNRAALNAALREPAPWDATCTTFGVPTSKPGLTFSASAGEVDLSFTTASWCDASPYQQFALGNWLADSDQDTTNPGIWGMPLMLGHAIWFGPGQVAWLR